MIITQTPFRMSFFGGGTDMKSFYKYQKGKVISTTIDRYIYVVVKKQLGIVEYKYRINWSEVEFKNSINEIKHPIVREALRYFKIDFPLEISTFSDIPANTGLASSSAFAVGLVHALLKIKKRKISKKIIASIAANIEINILKRNIGTQDHYACSFGGFNEITFNKNDTVKVEKLYISSEKLKILNSNLQLYFTLQKRDASEVLKNQSKLNDGQKIILSKLVELVSEAKKILKSKKKNFYLIGKLMHDSWILKKKLNKNVSNKVLDKYYSISQRYGSLGGKILGAGNGGFLLVYIKKKNQSLLKKKLTNLLKLNFKFEDKGTKILYEK